MIWNFIRHHLMWLGSGIFILFGVWINFDIPLELKRWITFSIMLLMAMLLGGSLINYYDKQNDFVDDKNYINIEDLKGD